MSNESEKEPKYARFFNQQDLERKQLKTLEELVEEGMGLSHLVFTEDKLEFLGPGTNKLAACLILDSAKTHVVASLHLEKKLLDQQKSQELWASQCDGKIVSESLKEGYLLVSDRLKDVGVAFLNGEEIPISLRMLKEPGYDHSNDPVLSLKLNPNP